ncbi:ATP-binding protein [Streptomyces sp. NPDC020607]|uniref:sensor histidine kinase n=1 Tax=Streptomyces sp. NPDC020607 TaxID=3365082 RepID=UPI00378C9472
MSHLRAPAARADRREGGRHGRPGSRTAAALPETHIRPQLLRIAVLPAVAVGLSACAAVLFTLRSTGARPDPVLLAVLTAAALVGLAGIVTAAIAAERAAKTVRDRIVVLRRATARGQTELRDVVEQLRRGDQPPTPAAPARIRAGGDEFDQLADELNRAQEAAVGAVVQASQLSSHAGSEQKVEVFVNLARRLQSLVHREISLLDDLENEVEDPELLKGLFHVDHLATRIRRHAENLAVLGGAVSRRQWSNPVSMYEVMRSAIAEVEQYSRVKLVPPIDGTLRGHAVADVIHLLAELVENATVFSAPHTQVLLRANFVTAGIAVEVEDRGLGMPVTEQNKMNRLLTDPDQVDVASLLQDGRIGLFVVSALARRHGVAVRLQSNIYGGVQAVLILPQELLGEEQEADPVTRRRPAAEAASRGAAEGGEGRGGEGARHAARAVVHADAPVWPDATPLQPHTHAHTHPQPLSRPTPLSQPTPQSELDPLSQPTPQSELDPLSQPTPQPELDPQSQLPALQPRPTPQSQSTLLSQPTPQSQPAPQSHPNSQSLPTPQPHDDHPESHPAVPAPAPAPAPPQPRTANGGRPAPLPVRGSRQGRPTPADATPGIRPEDRQAAAEHAAAPPTPRNGAVRGRVGRPQLPKRRAQEHIAPQLRGTPSPRPESDQIVGHDPGLMAAFQRGIGLAQAQDAREPTPREHRAGAPHDGQGHGG